jgi:hypothetical protein
MLELYNEHGLKVLAPIEVEEVDIDGTTIEVIDADKVNGVVATIVEEPTNDEFTKEYEDQKASFEGKKKQPKVAAGKTTGVKIMPEESEQLDELSKDTLGSYVKKATTSVSANSYRSGYVKGSDTGHNLAVGKKGPQKDHSSDSSSALGTARKRQAGIGKAVERLAKEEVELDEEYEYISEAEYLELSEEEQQFWEAVTSQSYSNLRDKKSKVPATEFGAKGTKTKVLDQIRSHESRKTHSTGKNVYATDYKVGKKDTAEMMYRKKSGKKGQIPSQRAGLRRDRYYEEVEHLDERTLTSGESKKKEEYVKGMKKGLSGFKQRYGERAKSVMYATATKMAKKD